MEFLKNNWLHIAFVGTIINYTFGLVNDKRKGELVDGEKREYEQLLREKYRIQKDRRMYDPPPVNNPEKQSLLDIGRRRD